MADNETRYVVYADVDKCIACRKCELACIASHNNMTVKEAIKARKKHEPRVHVFKTPDFKMPVQCHQCKDAPCAAVCPTHALIQHSGPNADIPDGQVVMRRQYCAGCGMCVMACPYGVITPAFINREEGEIVDPDRQEAPFLAVRCDQCEAWRASEGKDVSACMEACPAGVLSLSPLDEYRLKMSERGMDVI